MWNNLRISTRLFLLIGMLSALLVTVGSVGLLGMEAARESLHVVHEDNLVPMSRIAEIQQRLLRNRLAIAVALVTPDEATIRVRTAEVQEHIAAIDGAWQAFLARSLEPRERRLADEFAQARARFVKEGLQPTVAALRANDLKEAHRLVVESIRPLYEPVDAGIRALMQHELDGAAQQYSQAVERNRSVRAASLGAIVLGVLAAGVAGLLLVRTISASLDQAIAAADAVADGHLGVAIEPSGRHEITRLMSALLRMRNKLSQAVTGVRDGAEGVATASSQIAQGNLDLSARTEEQAASLEQTASSMEELTATVKQNAETARLADQLAKGASGIAGEAGHVVERVVTTMRNIEETSRRIAEIIGLIDGIALQTNILALNAAVEAARAGEHGTGFAVVASEVRTLAQRSAESAREIGTLITASVERVGDGMALAEQAGATMQQVVNAIQRVSDCVAEISAASHEQSQGIAQVADAVGQMDQVTQQNAALVEQSAAAAASLQTQARRLVESVAVFRFGAAGEAAAPARSA